MWSVPNVSATSRASASSLAASSRNPTENVLTGSDMFRAINATTRLESSPPESIAPSGTSLISRSRTDSSSEARRSSDASAAVISVGSGLGYAQYCSTETRSETTSRWPGSSLCTPASGVSGAGK